MQSDGPYKHYRLCDEAPCVEGSCMACVYAEGRKSMDTFPGYAYVIHAARDEGKQEGITEGRKSMEKDFKELLELANRLVAPAGPKFQAVTDFKAWKKARGIE